MKTKTISKIFFCCLNSKRTKYIEIILLFLNLLCFIFYILFFSTISWSFIHILNQLLYYLDFIFLLINIIINIYIIYIRRKRLINSRKNDIAKALSLSIILISSIALILNCFASYNILKSINNYDKNQNMIKHNNDNKKKYISSVTFIIIINIIWFLILLLWISDFIRIKIKSEDTFYNYLKKKAFKKNLYLFNEDYLKESSQQLQNSQNKNMKSKIKNNRNKDDLNSINMNLIKESNNINNENNISVDNNSIDINLSINSNQINTSQASSSLNDSYQKPVNMVIIGTDEKGYPIYGHQDSFDKSKVSNDSDSFSYQDKDKKLDQTNYIKYNDISINIEEQINDNENNNYEKNLILEKDNDEIKVVEKKEENDNNYDNNNFMPLENEENLKDIEENNEEKKIEKLADE